MNVREAICEYFKKDRGIQYTPDEVVVTPGGKPIIFLPILALVDHGDEVIYPNPGYPIYESAINFAGGKAVPLVYREERDFRFDMAELEAKISPKTKMLIINSPANPTGGVLEESDLKRIAELCVKNDVIVLSDEVYCKIIYEGKHHSIATYPGMKERTILMDAHSKTYAMTGWRLGFAAMPKPIAEKLTKLNTNVYSHATTFVQLAGIEALAGPQDKVKEMVATFDKRRKAIVDGMNKIKGFRCTMPKGAFYVFPNITGTGMKSKPLADMLLNEAGVACLSGTCFGAYGEGFLRFSYANSLTNIEKALERIKGVLAHQQ
jgi:aspartate/methionine/tyrosine aminotransferase